MDRIYDLLEKIKKLANQDEDILCVFLFGSYAQRKPNASSDIDICLVLNFDNYSSLKLSKKKLEYLKRFTGVDIQIFQQLPLYIKVRILKEGRIILCKDEDKIYNLAFSVITEYSDFEHIFREYLKEIENVR